MGRIVIGKYALESLTSGMYSDPFVIFREYIQNAVDSIDNAYAKNVIEKGQEQITVELLPFDGRIEISDNGAGIRLADAEKTLTGIGNSKKNQVFTRGFRGIGRLAALGYCKKLIFETSVKGEKEATKVIIDADNLADLIYYEDNEADAPADEVMDKVCLCDHYNCSPEAHYFRVVMEGIDTSSDLFKIDLVKEYLEQVAPVPYQQSFSWGKEIFERTKNNGYIIPSYRLQIRCGYEIIDVYKPYQDTFIIDKAHNEFDDIKDISIHKLVTSENKVAAIAWIAYSSFKCNISDKNIKGLRLRKGNIQIGGWQTLNTVFKDARFNGWIIGEVFVLSPNLLPNARRDNLEKNSAYFEFTEKLSSLASEIVKQIKAVTLKKNTELAKAVEKIDKAYSDTVKVLDNEHLSNGEKGAITQKLTSAQKAIEASQSNNEVEEVIHEIAFEQLDLLMGKVQGATAYKSINLLQKLTKPEKKLLERVLSVLYNNFPECESKKIVNVILDDFV